MTPDTSPKTCVIYNPWAGRGIAKTIVKNIQATLGKSIVLRPTRLPGHGVELARNAALEGFERIVAAGGDGTVHEVANGVLQANRPEVIFSTWPIGSANDYAYVLGMERGWRRFDRPTQVIAADVGQITGGGRSHFFVNGCGLGFNGAVTFESRKITWLRGMPLYGLAILKALMWRFEQPTLRISFDEVVRENPTLALSINLGQREGNFPVTPQAQLDDGLFDVIHVGPVTRIDFLKQMPNMAAGTLPTDRSEMWTSRCQRVRVQSPIPLRVHLDGEFFCHPDQGIREFDIQLLPGKLRVLRYLPSFD